MLPRADCCKAKTWNRRVFAGAGGNLSGGEKQRLNVAPALLMFMKISIFDEATDQQVNESVKPITQTI